MLKKLKVDLYGVGLFLSKMMLREETITEFLFAVYSKLRKQIFKTYMSHKLSWFLLVSHKWTNQERGRYKSLNG